MSIGDLVKVHWGNSDYSGDEDIDWGYASGVIMEKFGIGIRTLRPTNRRYVVTLMCSSMVTSPPTTLDDARWRHESRRPGQASTRGTMGRDWCSR